MGNWNLGSVQTEIGKIVLDIPTSLSSGTTIADIANQQMLFMQNYTGQTIGSTSIAEKYQHPLLFLTASALLNSMELQGIDVSSVKLGDFSESKGGASSSSQSKQYFWKLGMDSLRLLGKKMSYYKSNG